MQPLRFFIAVILSLLLTATHAQKLEKLYVNLYTDSLKRGTLNYINIDGLFSNGKFLPLYTVHLKYETSVGAFEGNKLWLPDSITIKDVHIRVHAKQNPQLEARFVVGIKQVPDPPLSNEMPVRDRRRG
jgi:hypothetical protein